MKKKKGPTPPTPLKKTYTKQFKTQGITYEQKIGVTTSGKYILIGTPIIVNPYK